MAATDVVFGPTADAFVAQDLPSNNFGSNSRLEVDRSSDRHALLKFTVTGVGSNTVSAATLRLYNVNGSSRGGDFYRVADNSWQEGTVTWTTAPIADGTPIASLGAVSANQWYAVDVTSAIAGDGTYSFRVTTTTSDGADYTSREGTSGFRPQLTVSYEAGGGSPDTTPPTATITAPADGATVSATVSVRASASDNVGVTHVEFFLDGALRSTDASSPYEFSWDTSGTSNGAHALAATAHDAAGNAGSSSTVNVTVSNETGGDPTVVFAGAAGDLGATSNTAATLAALDASGANFFLALGDLSYGASEQAWCDYVKSRLPTLGPTFPFELLVGNHEDSSGTDGYILNFAACLPDRLGSTLGPANRYGVEYYFDYPAAAPLVRVIMTAPDLSVDGVTYTYAAGDAHYNWAAGAIDGARAAAIPWVVVGMHKPGLSAGTHGGSVNPAFTNLLIQRRVDLVLEAHDHNYQRSKQLALGTGCSAVPYGSYDADCVADSGSDGQYGKTAGTVFVIDGTGGASLHSVSSSSAEGPYFAALNGTTYGFTKYTLTRDRLDATFVNSVGSFTDAFSIVGGSSPPPPPPPPDTTPPSAPTNLSATAGSAGGRVDLMWSASTDNVGVTGYRVLRDGVQIGSSSSTAYTDTTVGPDTTYTYSVTAYDAAGNVSGPSNTASVRTPLVLTFTPVGDAYVAAAAPGTNYGLATSVQVDASPVKHVLMKFTISGIGTHTVTGATLRLHNTDGSTVGGSFYRVADTAWSETSVTWSTAPVADSSPFASLGRVSPGNFYDVNASSLVAGDGTISFMIASTSKNGADYDSRESSAANRPTLIITLA